MLDNIIDKYSPKLSSSNPSKVIGLATLSVVISSVPLVYFFVLLFGAQYSGEIFVMSIAAPSLMIPSAIHIVIKLSSHLKFFQDELEKEIEKNKRKDLLLFEQARFALIGEMMANISHQWKQPLNTIGLSVVMAKTSRTYDDETNKCFDIIEDNVSYLSTTIDDFMSFFDKKTYNELRNLGSIVKEIRSIVGMHIANKKIDLEIKIDEKYGDVAVASSISQVILNLLNNAKDAISQTATHKKIELHFLVNEYGLEIACCDNGKGISDNIKDKIFNPYFTTKEKSQGTGIGLHMSREIVQKFFDGEININARATSRSLLSPLDHTYQTCFFIALPYSARCVLQNENNYTLTQK